MSEDGKPSVGAGPARLTRDMVVWLLSTPDRTEGSVNDPRERQEHGIRFNEKWLYEEPADDPAGASARIVYWDRYDFAGTVVRTGKEGPWRVDHELEKALRSERLRSHYTDRRSPQELELGLGQRDGRLYEVNSRNPAITPSNEYRPVSEFQGEPDLGGHIQTANKLSTEAERPGNVKGLLIETGGIKKVL